MTRRIDRKFHVDTNLQIVKTSSGETVPENEPLFLLRGRDYLAVALLSHYRQLSILDGCNDYHLQGLDAVIEEFSRFAETNPTKQPGITRGQPWKP